MAGLIALSDPPRPEAASFIAELRRLAVDAVVVTGDAAVTTSVVAREVGQIASDVSPEQYTVFAGVLPED